MVIELAFGDLKNRFKRCLYMNTTIENGVDIICHVLFYATRQSILWPGESLKNVLNSNADFAKFCRYVRDNLGERKCKLICHSVNTRRPVLAFRRRRI
jgi:hypothetical protein